MKKSGIDEEVGKLPKHQRGNERPDDMAFQLRGTRLAREAAADRPCAEWTVAFWAGSHVHTNVALTRAVRYVTTKCDASRRRG